MRKFNVQAVACALLLAAAIASPAVAANRLALVIGNAEYGKEPLLNPINDANAMTRKLTELGFQVTKHLELKRDEIGVAMDNFLSKVSPGDNVVFFYAGHGVQFDGENYLLSSDAKIRSQNDVPRNSISVSRFLQRLDATRAAVKIIFLDACRNNPFARSVRGSASRGLARIGGAPTGTLISFATQPGGLADDGERANGLYTEQLIEHIGTPGMAVEQVLKRVAKSTFAKSNGRQRPWIEGSLLGDFVFNPATAIDSRPAAGSSDDQYELQAWQLANESDSVELLEIFIKEYPESRRVPIARLKIASLKSKGRESSRDKKPAPVNALVARAEDSSKPLVGARYVVSVGDYSLEVQYTGTQFDIVKFINRSSLYSETEDVSCRSWTHGNALTVGDTLRYDQICVDENLAQTTGGDIRVVGTFPQISINGEKGVFTGKR